MLEIIKKKRDGIALSRAEINELISGLTSGEIPDYQISAFLMALYFKGMTDEETAWLTEAILRSGELIDLSEIEGVIVDKHSTGGVGDKTTLVLAPLVAAAGVPVAKMSGRGLGHTGGTIDKLESITGFNTNLTIEEFISKVKKHKIAICGQGEKLVPADKMLYALRDVTATVDNLALITSSIMSKKLACGADAIIIDMKVGIGAYMQTLEEAEKLAHTMIATGKKMDRKVMVLLSAMDQPLGNTVGNALEVKEAIQTLKGNGPDDLTELCLELGANMICMANKFSDKAEAKNHLMDLINSGAAFEKFKEFIDSQGGDVRMVDDTDLLPTCDFKYDVLSPVDGIVSSLSALEIGIASVLLGAGRENKQSLIDLGAGIVLNKKIGDSVKEGEILASLFTSNEEDIKRAESHVLKAYSFNGEINMRPLIIKTMQ